MRLVYEITYSGNGQGDPLKWVSLKVSRPQGSLLIAFDLTCHASPCTWTCGHGGPIVFQDDELPKCEANGEGVDWQIRCIDPDDRYKTMVVHGRHGVAQEPVPLWAPTSAQRESKHGLDETGLSQQSDYDQSSNRLDEV